MRGGKRTFYFLLTTLIVFLLSPFSLRAEHYLYQQIPMNPRLPTTLSCIYADSRGFVWTGTKFGLGRFDGHEQKRYTHQHAETTSLPGNQVYQILEDDRGNLWVLTDMGVARYNYRSNSFVTLTDGEGRPFVAYSAYRNGDCLLFGGMSTIYIYNKETIGPTKAYRLDADRKFAIAKLALASPDTLLCVSRWQGIYAIDLRSGRCRPAPFDCGKEVTDVFIDSKRRIWIAPYNQGLHCYAMDGRKLASYTTRNSDLSNDIVICITERKGQIWIGTDGGGINVLNADEEHFSLLKHVPGDKLYSLPTNSINCLYNDEYNNIWIGGVYNGLINMREVSMRTYTDVAWGNATGLSHNIVLCLQQESSERIWIGTDGGGLNAFDPTTERFTHYPSTEGDKVTSICAFGPGKLLMAAFAQGLFVFDTATGRKTPFAVIDEQTTNTLSKRGYSVYVHRNTDHTILLLSDHVYIYDLRNNTFSIATEEKENLIRWGTLQAITHTADYTFLFDSKRIYSLDHQTRMLHVLFACNSEVSINSVAYDHRGSFWIGTTQGLSRYIPAEGKLLPVRTKLFADVSLVVCGMEDEIWIGAESMLYSYFPDEDRFIIYGESDGAMPNEYIPRSQLVVPGKGIYMGGVNGLLYIASERTPKVVSPPELQMSDVIINGESAYSRIDKDDDELKVPWNSNIVIQIMAKEEDILREKWYRYHIKGLDRTYTETYNPEMTVQALRPGNYKIMASCTGKDGSWIPDRQILELTVLPPWYETWWFIIGCGLAASAFIIEVFRKVLRRKEHKLKWAMKEHEQQVYEEKVRFLINISHELRTPLTLIYAPLRRILKALPADNPQYQPLKAIYRQSQRMKALINTVLDLRKMEVGQSKLHVSPYPFNEWVRQVSQDFAGEGEAEQIQFSYQLSPQVEMVNFDRDKCEIVLSNLLVNALKHSPQNTTVTIASKLLPGGKEVRLSVSDQGCGLQQVNMEKLFTRFYQGGGEQSGTGIGLSYAKILVEQHGGSIGVRNNHGGPGATFYFDLPVHQNTEEITCQPRAYLNDLISDEHNDLTVEADSFDVSGYSVLVVDDNTDMTDFLKKSLADCFKHVWTAPDGVEALSIAKAQMPDIIVSDVMMPRMNGYQLCQRLKEDIAVSHIPVILLTARDDVQSQQDSYKNGADAYLTKPFEVDTLMELMRNRLRDRDYNRKRYMAAGPVPIPEETTISQADETFLLKLNTIIKEQLDNSSLDITFICREVGMSRASLYNKLKALTDMSANEYVNKFRMEQALALINTTDLPFTEVSERVGFTTPSYFSTAFKQYTGETPTQYKKRRKEEAQRRQKEDDQ